MKMQRILCIMGLLFCTSLLQTLDDEESNHDAKKIDALISLRDGSIKSDASATETRQFRAGSDGTIDTSYGADGVKNLINLGFPNGQAKAISVITTGTKANRIVVASSNGTDTYIQILNAGATNADSDAFGSGVSSVTLSGVVQAQAIMVDSTGLIFYILGTNGIVSALTYGLDTVTTFNTSSITTAYAITQQASGRILVAGQNDDTQGLIVAYTPDGVIDTSFNSTAGYNYTSPNNIPGYWNIGVTNPVTAISVGATSNTQQDADKIFFAYGNGSSEAVVDRLLANGTVLDVDFTFGTAITNVSDVTQIKMQLDADGKIVLVANTGSSAGIQASLYNVDGTDDVAIATILADSSGQRLQNILTLSNGTTLILAEIPNTTAATSYLNLARLTSAFVLDTVGFNASDGYLLSNAPSSSNTPAMIDFYAFDVAAAGGILIVGDNDQTASLANPYLVKIVNSDVVTKVSQSATTLGAPGELDTTCNAEGTDPGFIDLESELQVSGFVSTVAVRVLCQNTDGLYFIAGDSGENSYITQMSPDDVQTEGWGNSDPLDGILTLSGKGDLAGMIFTQSGSLIVVGGAGEPDSNSGWVQQLSPADGALYETFSPTATLDWHLAVAQQSNGRILVTGSNSDVGTIIAFNSDTGAVDTTFAIDGIYTAIGYGEINSILVDASDNIYCMANDSSDNAKVIKLVASGAEAASGWTIPTITANSTNGVNNHIAFDQLGNIIAVALDTTTPQIVVNSITAGSGALGTPLNLASGSTGITTSYVTSIVIDMNTSPGKVILTGHESGSPFSPFILRALADLTALDTTFNSDGAYPGVQSYNTVTSGIITNWYTAIINANGGITVGGYAGALSTPYLMRVYGDEFIGQYLPTVDAGTSGTIDTNFATSGYLSLIGDGQAVSAIPQVVLPSLTPGGSQYVVFDDGTISRYTNTNILDTTYGTGGHTITDCPDGVYSMSFLGNGGLLLAGTADSSQSGWVEQFTTAGVVDPDFNGGVAISFGTNTKGTVAVQQSSSRIVIAGQLASGNGALFAFSNTGVADTTFAIGSSAGTGIYDTGIATTVYAMITDQYDRLIIAYKNGSNVDIRRLTPSGELDTTFGVDGVISEAFSSGTVDDEMQVRIVIDAAGDIVIVAHIDTPEIALIKYNNITGNVVSPGQSTLPSLITPLLTGLIATSDGKILISGNSTTTLFNMWVARITSTQVLDTTTFASAGAIPGIMQFASGASASPTARNLTSITIYGDGQISMVGAETSSVGTVNSPFMARAYNTPYTRQEPLDLTAKSPGTNDFTFGVGITPNYVENGIKFFGTNNGTNQHARAVAIENGNVNGLVVAIDGESDTNPDNNYIYLNMFDIDGLLNTDFVQVSSPDNIDPGQALILSMFDDQHVHDMLTFTVDGISKAILVGYARNLSLSTSSSLLIQCVLTPSSPGLDRSFGGLNNNSLGVAFGDAYSLHTVGLQSTGRIIATGVAFDENGIVLGYTPAGNLDQSFGQGGTFVQGNYGVYTSAIDSSDRLVIAYYVDTGSGNNALTIARILSDGSGLDTTFGDDGILTTTMTALEDPEQIRLVIDGAGNIIVAGVIEGRTSFSIARYTSAGVLSGSIATFTDMDLGTLTSLLLSKLLVDINGAIIFIGSDFTPEFESEIVVARLVYSVTEYIFDSSFNSDGTPGFIKYELGNDPLQISYSGLIHPDGRIIIAGSEVVVS